MYYVHIDTAYINESKINNTILGISIVIRRRTRYTRVRYIRACEIRIYWISCVYALLDVGLNYENYTWLQIVLSGLLFTRSSRWPRSYNFHKNHFLRQQ